MREIKPCPFCGNKNIGVKDIIIDPKTWAYCRNTECGCSGPKIVLSEDSKLTDDQIMDLAIEAWNKRV